MNTSEQAGLDTHPGLWRRLAATFGPALAGLLGGALAGLLSLPIAAPLCRNMAATYAQYPTLQAPWLAAEPAWPGWLLAVFGLLGLAAPVAVGAVTVWLARPRDLWADLSAGLTAALAATVSAFISCVGWPVLLAFVVVPAIADLTLLSESTFENRQGKGAAEPLARRYPDLEAVEPEKRGGVLMAKIVSDQVAGAVAATGYGMIGALLTAGSLALFGTLAAGQLWRRGGRLGRAVLPYLEITLPSTATLALAGGVVLSSVGSSLLANHFLAAPGMILPVLVAVAACMVTAALRRWPWLLRLCLAFTWVGLYTQARPGGAVWLPLVGMILAACLFGRQLAGSFRRPVAPVAE